MLKEKRKIVLATRNKGKMREIAEMLGDLPIQLLSLDDVGFTEDIEETGATFEANALLKAIRVQELTRMPTFADDSGLECDALGGAPGIYSARFAGEHSTDEDNRRKLLHLMEGIPLEKRGAQFTCVIAYVNSGKHLFAGECKGRISFEEQGTKGFGYDPLFIPNGYTETFAMMSAEVKNALSHRGKAIARLKEYLLKHL